MVKRNKMISIDEDIIDMLKDERNVSGLINNLLKEYLDKNIIEQMSYEELERRIKLEKQKKEIEERFNEQLKELENV